MEPENGQFVEEFLLSAKNGGRTVQFFTDLRLRVLGIKHDEEISISIKPEQTNGEDKPKIEEDLENEGERRKREGNRARLNFPHPVFETQLLPGKRDFFFVHPTVNQVFTFVSTIDEEYKYIAVSARFNHAELSPQSVERVFEVKVAAMQGI